MIGAVDARNRLVTRVCAANRDGDMNLLLGFAGWAFHRHHNIVFVGH